MKTIPAFSFLMMTAAALSPRCYAETWTLDQCIDYAVTHNITLKQRQLDTMQAEQSVTDARSRYLPTVSANASQSWNLGRGLTAENTYANRNTSSFQWGASMNLPLFNGLATTRQVDYARANLAAVMEQFEAAREDVTLNVITAYLQVLYYKEMQNVQRGQVKLSEYEVERQKALLEAGKIPEVDYDEAVSQLAQDQLSLTQSVNDTELAILDLTQLLELPTMQGFDVAPLDKDSYLPAQDSETLYHEALGYNHGIMAYKKNIEAADKNITLAKSGYLPTLGFNAGIGSSYYSLSGMPNEGFGSQMRHNYSSYFGFSLNIPVFDAFSTRNSIRRAKTQRLQNELQLEDAQRQLYKTIEQALHQADAAEKKLEAAKVAENTSQKAFEAMQEKYNIGRATPTEYEQARTRALRATVERLQGEYELIIRRRILQFYSTPH